MVHSPNLHEFWLVDMGSANGTYLNGRRLTQPCRLTHGDQIDIAEFKITFHLPETREVTPAPRAMPADKTLQVVKTLDCWLLVADLEDSTQFVRRLPPEEAHRATATWLSDCKQLVEDHRGTVNKFLGDGLLAYWIEADDIAASVAKALLALKELQATGQPPFRLAVHYGKVMVGGAASLGEESLLGSEVNFVFRMEKLAGLLGAPRLLSEAAQAQLERLLPTEAEGSHALPSFEGKFPFFGF